MAGHQLIDDYLACLARRLPPDTVDELTDGLTESWQRHLDAGLTPADAAHAAITDFGTPEQTIGAFVTEAPGRRMARTLLATGPIMAACWAPSLITAHAWEWPIPTAAAPGYALTLLAVVAVLIAAATSRHSLRRTHLATIGGLGLIVLDAAMLAAALLIAPALAWPMAVAIPASLARIALTLRSLPKAFTH